MPVDFSATPTSATMHARPADNIDGAGTDLSALLERLILNTRALNVAEYDMGSDPKFPVVKLTQPTGAETIDSSVSAGKLVYTGGAANTTDNVRQACVMGKLGPMADSEVRSTWYSRGAALGSPYYQPGHVHRLRYDKQVEEVGTATGGSSTTITNSGATWATDQWAGGVNAKYRPHFVTTYDGTSPGQTRRITGNTGTVLTFSTAMSPHAPAAGTKYELWSYNTSCLVVAQNILSNANWAINFQTWGAAGLLPEGTGFADLTAYVQPGGTYRPFPWNVKTKVVGDQMYLAVWVDGDTESSYGQSGRSGQWTIPPGFEQPGYPGLYIGHLPAGAVFQYANVSAGRI